ncbi:MAG: hypothetical protein ABFQ65_03000 [Nanoarchaeota archaeon]
MENKFKDNLKILMYGDISKLEITMNHHFLDQLALTSDEKTQEPRTINELNDYISKGKFTHLLIPDENFHTLEGSLEKCIVPVIELLNDHWIPWAINKKKHYIKENGVKEAIVFSPRFQEPYRELVNLHTTLTGYNNSVFKNDNLDREIDVLIHGSLGEDTYKWVYPVRNWLADVLPEIGVKEGIKIEHWKHPGYWPKKDSPKSSIVKYSKILNKSKIAIGGTSYWKLLLKKFYEASACGAILLSDLPMEERSFFKGKIIEIDSIKMHSKKYVEEVKSKILWVLENYENVKKELQPFRNQQDIFNRSYQGRALEIRAIIAETIVNKT